MVFHWCMSDSESPQVSRSFLADLKCCNLDCLDSSFDFQFFQSFFPTLGTVLIGGIASLMFYCFFSSLIIFTLSFIFHFVRTEKSIRRKILFFFLFFFYLTLCLIFCPRSGDLFISQNPREFYETHSLGRILVYAYTICYYGQFFISCPITSGSTFQSGLTLLL